MNAKRTAEMRNEMKAITQQYYEEKVNTLKELPQTMKQKEWYTLDEVSAMTGLSKAEIIMQLSGECKAAREAGLSGREFLRCKRGVYKKYAAIDDNGNVNHDDIITVKTVKTYISRR